MKQIPYDAIKQMRTEMDLNQEEFWAPVGVTQSGGSRYENDRNIPVPVKLALYAVYILDIDFSEVEL